MSHQVSVTNLAILVAFLCHFGYKIQISAKMAALGNISSPEREAETNEYGLMTIDY
ncbi:hypothetical protein H6G18_15615 [Anabaena subtropica FACHB-260]|uniref:Uncharacterized protein n=1 Tax=Anabaena subtropica FACHB-260 TaxID=2692884 RepID=A0ABR8CRZ8_9NOST|nr:hypothetical protein [Anabaena subtropica FACHB-260]